ncbi:GNAT family N-acetyltransferase [Nocardia sp. 2]|uniref:GNAT family N-acetyltransferase n=1 Tax=Nocardia acididurans TaxID=2802282 RepID=A0ABS1M910_9NOCA|nr:GNAT family N-acetyltransferase [Nocardia acididurans]MBL1077054.1 GNAT family N-acetyltransferase [Nocardia acididurans]
MDLTVRPAQAADIPELGRVLGLAFQDDPIATWLLPDDATRARRNGYMFATLTRHQFLRHGGVEVAVDDAGAMVGAAVWASPGTWHTSQLTTLRCMPALVRAFRGNVMNAAKMSERMAEHHPREPHWYLAFIGTLPSARGKGYGQALLNSRLDRCDAEGVPAYLESSKPDNVPYYERFGFDKSGELDVTEGGPPLWPMWRTPR